MASARWHVEVSGGTLAPASWCAAKSVCSLALCSNSVLSGAGLCYVAVADMVAL